METNIKISHFKNVIDKNPIAITFNDFIISIKTGFVQGLSLIETINRIRQEADKEIRNKLKKTLPAVTISAYCNNGHKKTDILRLSGFMQMDIDGIQNVDEIKNILKEDPFLYVVFTSPSGNGLKCIFFIGDQEHKNVFEAISLYLKTKYSITVDNQVKDESRLCYYSYDTDIFVNPNYQLFKCSRYKSENDFNKVQQNVEKILFQIENSKKDITDSYENWRNIGFAFADYFGIDGEKYFHLVSKYNNGYNYETCSSQYSACLNSSNKGITIRTFFKLANDYGFQITESVKNNTTVFFSPVLDKDGNIKDIKIDYPKWIDILYKLGFRRFDIDKNFVFTRIIDQIIEEVSVTHIQDAFIHYLENLPEMLGNGVSREFLIGKFYRNPSHYFCENRLNLLRPKEPFKFNIDTKEDCLIYFKNGFVRCNKEGYILLPYSQLEGLIWKSQIVDRDFACLNTIELEPKKRGEFSHFTLNISGNDLQRYDSLTTIIGYLLHSHFSGKLKAVVFTDSKISDVANGRTGKTLLGQALGYVKKFTEINGKDFDTTNKHKYQEVNLDTQIVHLNDVRKNFDFECLFNDITEGIVADKKNTKPFKVKAKMIISTNKTICIEGASAKDRAIEFEFADYYNEKFSPEDEFHHWFFRDWTETEWMNFYNFCLFCICSYLQNGIIVAASVNLNRRKLIETTNPEFVEFMDSQVKDGNIKPSMEYDKKELFDRFINETPEYAEMKNFKQRRFTECLRNYAKYSGHFLAIDPEVHERKSGAFRYIVFPSI
jgi:hypothetical protein